MTHRIIEETELFTARLEGYEAAIEEALNEFWASKGRQTRCRMCESSYPKHEEDCIATDLYILLAKRQTARGALK